MEQRVRTVAEAALAVPGRRGRAQSPSQAVRAEAVELAVIASIRHEDTDYDELLMAGVDRAEARERVHNDVDRTLEAWRADAAVWG